MNVLLANHHTPYLFLLARALPEHHFHVLPTPGHAPNGWRFDHRPKPENVTIITDLMATLGKFFEVVISQTTDDLQHFPLLKAASYVPLVYLSHNRYEFEGFPPDQPWGKHRLVCISPMKAESWRDAGYRGDITTILPYAEMSDYEPWTGGGGYVLTVANNLRRPLFDAPAWIEATKGARARLIGEGNEGLPGAVGPSRSWDALRDEYRRCDEYLNPTAPPFEDTWNLALIEALASGAPVRYLHPRPLPLGSLIGPGAKERFAQSWRQVLEEVTNVL